jgi:hypothetical protein
VPLFHNIRNQITSLGRPLGSDMRWVMGVLVDSATGRTTQRRRVSHGE